MMPATVKTKDAKEKAKDASGKAAATRSTNVHQPHFSRFIQSQRRVARELEEEEEEEEMIRTDRVSIRDTKEGCEGERVVQ